MAKRKRLGELLVEACIISPEQLDEALQFQQHTPQLIGQILIQMGWVSEEDVCRAVAELLHIDYVDVDGALISQEVVQLAPEPLAAQKNILPLFIQDKTLFVAMENPLDVEVIQRIEFRTGMQIKPLIAPPSQLRETVRKHYNVDEYVGSMLNNTSPQESVSVEHEENDAVVDIEEVRKISEGNQVVKLANLILAEGIKRRASDIHLEPSATYSSVRYRVDGLLMRGIRIPKWLKLPLISRLKIIAGMDIAERRKPQDGRIRVTYMNRKIDLRVSTLRTNFGEKVVIRILDNAKGSQDLMNLGMSRQHLHVYRRMLSQPQGWILVTGPTGSGKTTTLYASLQAVKDVTKNIITVEDPIEYQLPGISQVPVNPKAGMTFAAGLRSILRQDPNVIMVGEIRDTETAEIALQASETGHLILSTLHTNDAVSTVNRLFNLGLSPDVVASNLLVIIAQRLVRKICPQCKIEYPPTEEEWRSLGLYHPTQHEQVCYKGRGCPACHHTGYSGQIGIYELLVNNDALQELIAQHPTKYALKRLAREIGMKTMLEDGLEKLQQGITTIEEVARVCPVDPDERRQSVSCPQCGNAVSSDTPVCPYCQHILQTLCLQCQAPLEENWSFCPICGKPVSASKSHIYTAQVSSDVTDEKTSSPPPDEKSPDRILVAEDEAPVQDMLCTLLRQRGYEVISAFDGQEAIEKVRAEQPDLVLLDIQMPKQDGFSVCKTLRSNMDTMFIPVVILTGQVSMDEKKKGLECGADEYITKPFDAENLLAQIATCLQRSSTQNDAEAN